MTPGILLVIDSDPRTSPRPAEAVRMAAGIGVWKKVSVSLYLRDAAVLILGEDSDELVDGDNFKRYLPLVVGLGRPIYVQKGAPGLAQLGSATALLQEISSGELAELAARQSQVIRF